MTDTVMMGANVLPTMASLRLMSFVMAGLAGALMIAGAFLAFAPPDPDCADAPNRLQCEKDGYDATFQLVLILWGVGIGVTLVAIALYILWMRNRPRKPAVAPRVVSSAASHEGRDVPGQPLRAPGPRR